MNININGIITFLMFKPISSMKKKDFSKQHPFKHQKIYLVWMLDQTEQKFYTKTNNNDNSC